MGDSTTRRKSRRSSRRSIDGLSAIYHQASAHKDFSDTYDFVMVFSLDVPGNLEMQSNHMKHCIAQMLKAGLEIYPYPSVQEDEAIILIRVPEDILASFTDKIDYKILADPVELQKAIEAGDPENKINGVEINDDPMYSSYSPFDYIYLTFEEDISRKIYAVNYGETSCFSKLQRLKILFYLLRAPERQGGCDLRLTDLMYNQKIKDFYPMHDKQISHPLFLRINYWKVLPWDVPVDQIRDYFGEKIGLYNVFIGHYSKWLVPVAIIGVAFQMVTFAQISENNFSSPVLPFYSVIMCFWSVFMLEYWKRTESTTALKWGMTDFESKEPIRPEYHGKPINSFIDGSVILYADPLRTALNFRISRFIIASFVMAVIGVVAGIYTMKFTLLQAAVGGSGASTVASLLNTVQITVFNMIYEVMAVKLTNLENHSTDTLYEDALILKLFIFQFINSYSSFFFLAFIASSLPRPEGAPEEDLGACGAENCMYPLMLNLTIIFGLRLTLTNAIEIAVPWIMYKLKLRTETKGHEEKRLTPAEDDYMMNSYRPTVDGIKSYADTAVQYGFTLLFIPALPMATFLGLINNYAKLKFDA